MKSHLAPHGPWVVMKTRPHSLERFTVCIAGIETLQKMAAAAYPNR
ncbi:hypothetical protein [Desulfosarcina sp.]